ncbi:MAG: hypothetical protein OHK0039_36880 [Bacteroidia bacterium]
MDKLLSLLQAINEAAAVLLTEQNAQQAISRALGMVGQATNVDRVYIFQNVAVLGEEQMVSQRFEWVRDHVSIQLDNPELQNIPYDAAGLARWKEVMLQRKAIRGLVKDFPQSERDLLDPQDILSLICLPIYIKDEFWGFVGFDDCSSERIWSRQEEQILFNLATSLGGVFMRQRYEDSILRYQAELEEAQRIAQMGNFEYDFRAQEVRLSQEVLRIHGLERIEDFPQGIVPDMYPEPYRTRMATLAAACLMQGQPFDEVFLLHPPGGEAKWVRMICHPITEGGHTWKLKGVLIDVTASEQARRQQYELSQRLMLASQAGKIGFWNWHVLQDRLSWDAEVGRFFGIEASEQGQPIATALAYVHPDDVGQIHRALELVRDGTQQQISLEVRVRFVESLGWKDIVVHAYLDRDERGQIVQFVGVALDMTEDRLVRRELIAAKEQSEQANRAKSEFLSVISHEIRTPLNAVIGFADLLHSEGPRPDQTEYIDSLRISSQNLLSLINDVLDYSKIEAGRIDIERVEVSLPRLIQSVLKTHLHRAEERQVRLEAALDPRLPDLVVTDPVRLGQVLNNLISNAIKFTEQGTVTVRLTLVRDGIDDVSVRFEVQDTGIGIDPALHGKIFDRFTQANSSTTRRYGGTGLGLTITRQLVHLMGGRIQVESQPGMGSTFFFQLVLSRAAVSSSQSEHMGKDEQIEHLQGLRVLVVEDNAINRKIVGKFLANWQVSHVDFAADGAEGVAASQRGCYDVILMDLQMPVMGGEEAAQKIRAEGNQTPIVALTADAMPDVRERILAAGMNDLTTKPFHPQSLFEKLARYLPQQTLFA